MLAAIVVALLSSALASTTTVVGPAVTGRVLIDSDGDGKVSDGDMPALGVVVAFEHEVFAITDNDGRYHLAMPPRRGIVWVRTPSTCRPGPVFARVRSSVMPDLLLQPLTAAEQGSPIRFALTSDSHIPPLDAHDIWDGGDLAGALTQVLGGGQLRFVATLGDVTQGGTPAEYRAVRAAVASTLTRAGVPWISVVGNHDRTEDADGFHRNLGPEDYSFDVGKVHFVVWDTIADNSETQRFLDEDLALVDPSMTVVALGHYAPDDNQADMLADAGVRYLFTGHWHASRDDERAGMRRWTIGPITMGGLDLSPAGYRVVEIIDGVPTVTFHETMRVPVLAITGPSSLGCLLAGGGVVTVAAAGDFDARPSLMLDGKDVPLHAVGGWSWQGDAPPVTGSRVEATLTMPRHAAVLSTISICHDDARSPKSGDWSQLGGGPSHQGERSAIVDGELREAWATAVGGPILGGSPVVSDGIVVVAVSDLGTGDRGGVVALDQGTGAIVWRVTTKWPVRNAPAIDHGVVVVPQSNGELLALELKTGAERWRYDFRADLHVDPPNPQTTDQATLWAAPAVADGVVYLGTQGRFAALDIQSGRPQWIADPKNEDRPWLGAFSSATIDRDLVIATLNRESGIIAFDRKTGAIVWHQVIAAVGSFCQPVVGENWVALATTADQVLILNRATGALASVLTLDPRSFEWGNAITGAPATHGTTLFIPTHYETVVAVDLAKNEVAWQAEAGLGPLALTHYRSYTDGFVAAPVITGDRLWIGDTAGALTAYAIDTGVMLDRVQLGVPLLAGPAIVDRGLVIASYDGTVRMLAMPHDHTPRVVVTSSPRSRRRTWQLSLLGLGAFMIAFGAIRIFRRRIA